MTASHEHQNGLLWTTANLLAGREALLERFVAELQPESTGVFLTGANGRSGVLVNAISRELVRRSGHAFAGGVYAIDLQGYAPLSHTPMDADQAQRIILSHILAPGQMPRDSRTLTRLYRDTFADRNALLLLTDAADPQQLRHLIPREGSTVIVTSVRDLSSSFPKLQPHFIGGLTPESAYQLFTSVSPRALLQNKRVIIKLCEFLELSPLTIALTAPQLDANPRIILREVMTQFQIARQRIEALRGGPTPPSTLEVALELAYENLSAEHQHRFAQLGVFPAVFSPEAARIVWNISQADTSHMLRILAQRNLIEVIPQTNQITQHWAIHRYAESRLLNQPNMASEATVRFIQYVFQQTLPEARAELDPEQPLDTGLLALITDHFIHAWLRSNNQASGWTHVSVDPQLRLSTFLRLSRPLHAVLTQSIFDQWLNTAIELAQEVEDQSILEKLQHIRHTW